MERKSSGAGFFPFSILKFENGSLKKVEELVAQERRVDIKINGRFYQSVMASPRRLKELGWGLLYGDGLVDAPPDFGHIKIKRRNLVYEVDLSLKNNVEPSGSIARAGSFRPKLKTAEASSGFQLSLDRLLKLVKRFQGQSRLFIQTGAVHSCAFYQGRFCAFADDVGRHNALDKVIGLAAAKGFAPGLGLMMATGRISTEMLLKVARVGTSILVSRGGPTDRAVALAKELGLTLIGFARGHEFFVYAGAERLEGLPGAVDFKIAWYKDGRLKEACAVLVEEQLVEVFIDGRPYLKALATLKQLDALAIGLLLGDGLIDNLSDIKSLSVDEKRARVEVVLNRPFSLDVAKVRLSGFGQGQMSVSGLENAFFQPLSDRRFCAGQILNDMREFIGSSLLFQETRASHSACFVDGDVRIFAEDVGRHNALDKVIGQIFLKSLNPAEGFMLVTGRVSTEIVLKTARAGISALIARGGPTDQAVLAARTLGMVLIAFARGGGFNVYAGGHRLVAGYLD